MREAEAIIERVRRVSATVQRLDVAVDLSHRNVGAGQLFLARTTTSLDPYLREPWTPVRIEGASLVMERPAGQVYTPGQVINLIGPVGRPIPLRDSIRTLLLVAHEATPASLLLLAETALAKGLAVTLALSGAALHYPLEALPEELEVIHAAEDGQWPDQPETLRWAEQIVAVAPPPFDMTYYGQVLQNIRQVRIEVPAQYVFGLFQPPMPCGVGACQACLVRSEGEDKPACLEGPAFDLLTLNELSQESGP
jgi:dihydroorotate dehydrogenase electron transfer subunit